MPYLLPAPHALLAHASPLLALAVVLIAGVLGGLAARRAGLPRVTGQILVGVALGPSALHLLEEDALHSLAPLTQFALALMTMAVGSHLDLRRLRNAGRRLGYLLAFEAVVTPVVVFAVLRGLMGVTPEAAALLGALSISTAPATIVALVKETRSRGVFVKTLVAAVALNNIACILIFSAALDVVRLTHGGASALGPEVLARPFLDLGIGAVLGGGLGWLLVHGTRRITRPDHLATATLIALLLAAGVADLVGVPPLLASLFLGVSIVNIHPHREGIGDQVFLVFEDVILCAFFTMAGLELHLEDAARAGPLVAALVASRALGKMLAAQGAMALVGTPRAMQRYLGLALVPQAGVAVGLLLVVAKDPRLSGLASTMIAIGVTGVAVNEVIGPVLTRYALRGSGEAGKDRARLIDFLREENIITDLVAETKEEAVERLVDLMIRSNYLSMDRERLLESVLDREQEASTCVGSGLAVPHGVLEQGGEILGVMGISREGLGFETPDGEPVHCMVLLATPSEKRDRHLETLAALGRIVQDPERREVLFHAASPAHAHVILQAEEFEEFNYFLEEMENF